MSFNSNFVALFHLIAIFHYIIAICYDFMYVENFKGDFGGKFVYLGTWTLFIQLFYFIIAFINEFIGYSDVTSTDRTPFSRFKDYFFATFSFPFAFNTGFVFWLLFFIDQEFLAPEEFFDATPIWFIHMTRTNIMIFIIIEAIINNIRYPNPVIALPGLLTVLLVYMIWTVVIYVNCGYWVYPIVQKFDWPQRVGFFTFNIFVPVTFYFIGDILNKQIWSKKWKCIEGFRKGEIDVKQDGRRSRSEAGGGRVSEV